VLGVGQAVGTIDKTRETLPPPASADETDANAEATDPPYAGRNCRRRASRSCDCCCRSNSSQNPDGFRYRKYRQSLRLSISGRVGRY
jgi:hypothetical protein